MIEEIQKCDSGFTEQGLFQYAEDIFNALISDIMNFNMSNLYPYLDETIYNKYVEIIEGYKRMKIKRVFENVSFKNKMIQSYGANESQVRIKLLMMTKYKDYFVHENGELVDEASPEYIEKGHYLTFTRDLTDKNSRYIVKEMDVI